MNPFQRAQQKIDDQLTEHFGIQMVLVIGGMHHPITGILLTPEELNGVRVKARVNDHRIGRAEVSRSIYQIEIPNDQIIGLPVVAGVIGHINSAKFEITKPEPVAANTSTFNMIATGDQI